MTKRIQALLLSVFLLLFGVRYYLSFPVPVWGQRGFEIGALLVIFCAAFGTGQRTLRLFGLGGSLSFETTFFSALLGFGILALAIFGLTVAHGLYPATVLAALMGMIAWGWPDLRQSFARTHFKTPSPLLPPGGKETLKSCPFPLLDLVFLFATVAGLLLAAVAALAPPTFYDSLVYHLAIPSAYLQAHGWIHHPIDIYSAFPKVGEMLFATGLALGDDVIANGIAYLLGLLSVIGTVAFATRCFGQREAWTAAFLLAMTPAFLFLSSGPYIETATMAFSFGTFYACHLWRETRQRPWLWLAGVLGGLTIGTKYTGAIFVAAAGLLILRAPLPSPPSEGRGRLCFRDLFVFAGLVILTWSPWLVENTIAFGNPVYPFFYRCMAEGPLKEEAIHYFEILGDYRPHSGFLTELLAIPFRPLRFGGGYDVLGDLGWGMYIVFIPLLFFLPKRDKSLAALGLYAGASFLGWGLTRWVLRFLTPILPALALGVAVALRNGLSRFSRWTRLISGTVLAFFVITHAYLFFFVEDIVRPFRVAIGLESREDYLAHRLTHYGAYRFMQRLSPLAHVLIVGDQRGYPCPRRYTLSSIYRLNPLVRWANELPSSGALKEHLYKEGFTHVYVNDHEMHRLQNYVAFSWTPEGRVRWERLRRELAPLYQDPYGTVYRL